MINVTGTIDMQHMRYLNLFKKITYIDTRYCFKYNEMIVFCVPKQLLSRALGENGNNLRRLSDIVGKRIRIVPIPLKVEHAKEFIQAIVAPLEFNDLTIGENEIVLTAGSRNKASLIGRNKRRLIEMKQIVKDFFGKDFRII